MLSNVLLNISLAHEWWKCHPIPSLPFPSLTHNPTKTMTPPTHMLLFPRTTYRISSADTISAPLKWSKCLSTRPMMLILFKFLCPPSSSGSSVLPRALFPPFAAILTKPSTPTEWKTICQNEQKKRVSQPPLLSKWQIIIRYMPPPHTKYSARISFAPLSLK